MLADTRPQLLLTVDGVLYQLEIVEPGRFFVLTKYGAPSGYTVIKTPSGPAQCMCRGYISRRHCKHVRALEQMKLVESWEPAEQPQPAGAVEF